jgi:hypothetical protein
LSCPRATWAWCRRPSWPTWTPGWTAADALAALDLPLPPEVDWGRPEPDGRRADGPLRGQCVAIARDAAFAFLYPANVQLLQRLGAGLCFFSPLADEPVPEGATAVYLPGGYPELHAATLAAAQRARRSLQAHHAAGRPLVAECGGMLALAEGLTDAQGTRHAGWGLLPGEARMSPRLVNLGLHAAELPEGTVRGHTFHHARFESPLPRWPTPRPNATTASPRRSTARAACRPASCTPTSQRPGGGGALVLGLSPGGPGGRGGVDTLGGPRPCPSTMTDTPSPSTAMPAIEASRVVADELRFKAKLAIGEQADASLRAVNRAREIWDVLGAAGTGAAVAKSSLVASTFFAPGGLLGAVGLGTAATPIGWVAFAALASGGACYGLYRLLGNRRGERVIEIPRYLNTPLDQLGLAIFDLIAPLAVRMAAVDGRVERAELDHLQQHLVREWGLDEAFVNQARAHHRRGLGRRPPAWPASAAPSCTPTPIATTRPLQPMCCRACARCWKPPAPSRPTRPRPWTRWRPCWPRRRASWPRPGSRPASGRRRRAPAWCRAGSGLSQGGRRWSAPPARWPSACPAC